MATFGLAAAFGWLTLTSLFGGRRDGLPEIDASLVAFVNTVAFGSVCLLGARLARRPVAETFRLGGFPPRLLVPVLLVGVAAPVLLEALIVLPFRVGVLEFPDEMYRGFLEPMIDLLLANPAATFVAVVVVAPLTEEFFFRGLLLRGFEQRYGGSAAIGLTTVLFSLAHLNPVQLPATLFLGFYLGWLTLRTRSVWPAVIAHAANNLLGFLSLDAAQADLPPEELLRLPEPGVLLGAGVCLVAGGALLLRFLPARERV
jgi:membrane protease YdiL (CAAX protease family)